MDDLDKKNLNKEAIKFLDYSFEELIKEIKTPLLREANKKCLNFQESPYAGDFNKERLYEMAEDTAMMVAIRVLNYYTFIKKPTAKNKKLKMVEPKGMYNYAVRSFINDCAKKYQSITGTEVHGSIVAISSDDALNVAASKNLYDPEFDVIVNKEFELIISKLKEKDEAKNKNVLDRKLKTLSEDLAEEDKDTLHKLLTLKSLGYDFLNYDNSKLKKDILKNDYALWKKKNDMFNLNIHLWIDDNNLIDLHKKYDLKLENNDFFFMSKTTQLILDGYSTEDIKFLLGINTSGFNKQKKLLVEEASSFVDKDYEFYNNFVNRTIDPRIYGKKIKQSYFWNEDLDMNIDFCIETVKNENNFNLVLKGIFKLQGLESGKGKYTRILNLETIKNLEEKDLFFQQQNFKKLIKDDKYKQELFDKYYKKTVSLHKKEIRDKQDNIKLNKKTS